MFGDDAVAELDAANAAAGAVNLRILEAVRTIAVSGAWRGDGARDLPHWLSIRYGISWWKGRRMVAASRTIASLPVIREALGAGQLSLDKALELCRFAAPREELEQLAWAQRVSMGAVRQKGDLFERQSKKEMLGAERRRSLNWFWTDEGRRLMLSAELPAAQGAVAVKAIERMAAKVPSMPDEEGMSGIDARRADALVAICSAKLASDPDAERTQIVVHAGADTLAALAREDGLRRAGVSRREVARKVAAAAFEGGPAIHPDVLSRLLCTSRVQAVVEDENGNALSLGRASRDPSPQMMRQLRYRDTGCRFPGCGTKAFINAHHVEYWSRGGRTDLDNLVLLCSFHHRLVHEHGWSATLEEGEVTWRRPGGALYRAGPSPGEIGARDREWVESLERRRRWFLENWEAAPVPTLAGDPQPVLSGVG